MPSQATQRRALSATHANVSARSVLRANCEVRTSGSTGRCAVPAAGSRRAPPPPPWPTLPSVQDIALAKHVLNISLPLPYSSEEYCQEAEAMRMEWPELVWQRSGKPDKASLGPRTRAEDWVKYENACPKTVATVTQLLMALSDQDVQVAFGDILDYQPGHLLGWHQDSMDLTRHTFTMVLTLAADGDGRFEWREINSDGQSLGETVSSVCPRPGDLAIHGLACNNALAHRVFWDVGRRVTLVLFCRSEPMQAVLSAHELTSNITMRHWWCKDFETTK